MADMKKNTSHTIRRAQRFPVILIGEGLLVGIVGGLIVLLYRVALSYAGDWLHAILSYIKGRPIWIAGWFLVLVLLAVVVGKLVKWEPMISGSGIPQVEGEVTGKLRQTLSDDMRSKRRAGGGVSCAACRRDVCDRGDP